MKIKIVRNTVVNGMPVETGKIVETSERDAKYLIGLGKAMLVISEKATVEAPEKTVIEKHETRKTR